MVKPPPQTLLVPVDFSESSLAALRSAEVLARRWGARIVAVHPSEGGPPSLDEGMPGGEEGPGLERFRTGLRARLLRALGGYPDASARVEDGPVGEALPRLAAEQGVGLVVLGTSLRTGLRRLGPGSPPERLAPKLVVPVLLVHTAPPPSWPERVLVPMKFTRHADQALAYALEFALSLGAELTVVHVPEPGPPAEQALAALRGHLAWLAEDAGLRGLELLVGGGEPAQGIVAAAVEGGFDLIVLAGHRRSFLRDGLLRTTAERVLRGSPVPVLSVPEEEPRATELGERLLARTLLRRQTA